MYKFLERNVEILEVPDIKKIVDSYLHFKYLSVKRKNQEIAKSLFSIIGITRPYDNIEKARDLLGFIYAINKKDLFKIKGYISSQELPEELEKKIKKSKFYKKRRWFLIV